MARKFNIFVVTLFLWLVVVSGMAGWLGYRHLALWPWSHQWYMFSYSGDYLLKLRAIGYTEEYLGVDIPLEKYFTYPVTSTTHRADEIHRTQDALTKFAQFLCRKNPTLAKIQLNQDKYFKQPGRLPDLTNSSESVRVLLQPTPCKSVSSHDR